MKYKNELIDMLEAKWKPVLELFNPVEYNASVLFENIHMHCQRTNTHDMFSDNLEACNKLLSAYIESGVDVHIINGPVSLINEKGEVDMEGTIPIEMKRESGILKLPKDVKNLYFYYGFIDEGKFIFRMCVK